MRFKNALFVIEKNMEIPHDYIDEFKQEIKEVIRVRSFLPHHPIGGGVKRVWLAYGQAAQTPWQYDNPALS